MAFSMGYSQSSACSPHTHDLWCPLHMYCVSFQLPICPLTPWGMVISTHTLKETRGGSTCLRQMEFFVLSSSVDSSAAAYVNW